MLYFLQGRSVELNCRRRRWMEETIENTLGKGRRKDEEQQILLKRQNFHDLEEEGRDVPVYQSIAVGTERISLV